MPHAGFKRKVAFIQAHCYIKYIAPQEKMLAESQPVHRIRVRVRGKQKQQHKEPVTPLTKETKAPMTARSNLYRNI